MRDRFQHTSDAHAQVALVVGYVLLIVFLGLGASSSGLRITFQGTLTTSSPGELNFWLGHALLLFPASLLIGYGMAGELSDAIRFVGSKARSLNKRDGRLAVICLVLVAVAIARLGHAIVLLDLPITDDEYAVDFGGRVLASGHVMTHLGLPNNALPGLFLYFRDSAVGSFDWLGGQAIAAIGHVTRLGPLAWAVVAAIPVGVLAALMRIRLGPEWGIGASLLFLCSPMALLFSMTTHSQLGSRAFLAAAIMAFARADHDGGFRRWVVTGVCVGIAFLCRPIEVVFFSVPICVWTVWQNARGDTRYRGAVLGLMSGGCVFVALFVWNAYATTGNPFLPTRFAVPANADIVSTPLWTRFGENVSYNVFMLAIWFLGPIGLILIAAGALTDRLTKLLGLCIAADLCLAFFHDNPGLHVVGPIHYSECAVPLAIIATHGLANILEQARRHLIDPRPIIASVAAALVLGLGLFSLVQANALHRQAVVQREIYGAIEGAVRDSAGRKAVVFAPWMLSVVNAIPAMRSVGSWVHEWRRPKLDLSDDVLFLTDRPGVEDAVCAKFPERRFFRLRRDDKSPFLVLAQVGTGEPIRLVALGPTDGLAVISRDGRPE